MKLKHQSVRVQQNKQGVQRGGRPSEVGAEQQQPGSAQAYYPAEAAGNNQSSPDETDPAEPGQLSNHQGQQPQPSLQANSRHQSPRIATHHRQNANPSASNMNSVMGNSVANHQLSKRNKQNFMQQQNRPIQKGKGKRIFLEMRDSQLVPSSSDQSLSVGMGSARDSRAQPQSTNPFANASPHTIVVGKSSNSTRQQQERGTNPQLQQKIIGNSRDDSMLQLDSDGNEQNMPQAAINEMRQLSSRSGGPRKQSQVSDGVASLPGQNQQVFISQEQNNQFSHNAGSNSYHHGHNMSQAAIHNHGEDPDAESSHDYPSVHSTSKPVSGEGQIKFTTGQQHHINQRDSHHHQPYPSQSENGRSQRTVKRQSTQDLIAQQEQRSQMLKNVAASELKELSGQASLLAIGPGGHGMDKVSHPGVARVLSNTGTGSNSGSVFVSYEKLAKAVEAMTKQITMKHELLLKDRGFSVIPEALRFQCHSFEQLLILDLQNNSITELDGDFCQNFPCLEKLDLRNNKIKSVNPHIKALMSLQVLRLDNNQLTQLVPQIGNLKLLEELSVSNNRLFEIPQNFGENLTQLHTLNVADNSIKSLPASLGNLGKYNLKCLFLHGNNFTSFPSTFLHMCNLEELSLEWFLYAKPSKPKLVRRATEDGRNVFESLEQLFNLLVRHSMNECMLIIFLEYYSVDDFEVNHKDNRQRTPLHNASAKGDNGVLEGLLQGNADPNILDKDNCTPLCLAIRDEKFAAAQILIDSEEVDVNMGGGIYGSPLHLAVVKLEIWLIKALIKKGADVNKTDCDGKTALHFVMNLFSKNPQKCQYIAETLVLNGAKPNLKDTDNWTPLHTAVRKGQDKGVAAIAKLNKLLVDKEKFDMNATGGVHKWTALHLAAHGGHLNIVRELLKAGADIFQRNTNNQLPRHCAKGNYILTKFIKMAEQSRTSLVYNTYVIGNQFQLIRGLTMRKPNETKPAASTPQQIQEMIQGYNNLVSTLKLVRKHRPFAENDNLPKICQPEDHIEVSSPRSSSSEQEKQAMIDAEEEGSPFKIPLQLIEESKEAVKTVGNFGDQGLAGPQSDDDAAPNLIQLVAASKPEMGPNCNLKSMFTENEQQLSSNKGTINSNTDRFQRLSALAEDRKVNLFYLKDTIFNKDASMLEKLDAMSQIRRNVGLPVFKFAIETVLTKFHQIPERSLQLELISIIGKSQQPELLRGLQKLLVCNVKNLNTDVADEIEEAICELKASTKKIIPNSLTYQLPGQTQVNNKGLIRARNVSGSGSQGMIHHQQMSSMGLPSNQAPSPHPKSIKPPMVGGGNNQSVLAMSVHSHLEISPRTANRKLGHPGAVRDTSNMECSSNEDTLKRAGTMFEFQKPVVHAGLSSVQGSSLGSGSLNGPPSHQGSSTVSQPGITRQTIICDNPSPIITNDKVRGIPSTLVLSESKFIAAQNQHQVQPGNIVVTGSAHFGRINPSNKVVSKQNMVQSLVNNMSSSLQSSSNAQHEEDVSSSHVDTDKPHKMSINPSLTYSVAGVSRDAARKKQDEEVKQRAVAPSDKIEKPNLPRVSQKVNKQQMAAGAQNSSAYHHPGSMKNSFTNQLNVSIGSMSDSLNTHFLMKKAAQGRGNRHPLNPRSSQVSEQQKPSQRGVTGNIIIDVDEALDDDVVNISIEHQERVNQL